MTFEEYQDKLQTLVNQAQEELNGITSKNPRKNARKIEKINKKYQKKMAALKANYEKNKK